MHYIKALAAIELYNIRNKDEEPFREHEHSKKCWCKPILDDTDPETGEEHWLHNEE